LPIAPNVSDREGSDVGRLIAITGAGGLIGHVLTEGLESGYELRGLDRRWRHGAFRRRQDVRNRAHTARVFAGADTVIDLAADPHPDIPWRTVERDNIPTTIETFEAAARAGVSRVIFASSAHVTGLYENEEPYASILAGRYDGLDPAATPLITSFDPIRPNGTYAVGKAAGEAAARYFSDAFGLSIICLRLGLVTHDSRPSTPRAFATLLTHGDLLRLVGACIEAPADLRFAVVYGVSGNTWRIWDLDEPNQLLGYQPRDNAEQWRQAAVVAVP
jgi:nucleoside-diphosphate-sugar epimerase